MRSASIALAVLVGLLVGTTGLGQTAPAALPTQAQLQQMVEAKAYRPALQAIARILPMVTAGKAPEYDKYTLLMIRGECLVQLKDGATASIAFDQAMAAAGTRQEDEAARAMLVLVKKSPGVTYTPRTGDKKPLDLTDLGMRKLAMAALFGDELAGVSARIGEALKGKSLTPILALGPTLRDLHALEEVSSGQDTQMAALVRPLADRMEELIDAELNRIEQQVKAIERAANRTVDYAGGNFQMVDGALRWVPAQGTSGLSGDNRQALRETITYLGKISDTCEDLGAVARRYDRDGKRWAALAKRTKGQLDLATAVYEHE